MFELLRHRRHHPWWSTHVDPDGGMVRHAADRGVGGQEPIAARIDDVGVQPWVLRGSGSDFVEVDGLRLMIDRVAERNVPIESPIKCANPADERRDPRAARNPDLLVTTLVVVETTERAREFRGRARLSSLATCFSAFSSALSTACSSVLSPTMTNAACPASMSSPNSLQSARDMPRHKWPLTAPTAAPPAVVMMIAGGNRQPMSAPTAAPPHPPCRVAISSLTADPLPAPRMAGQLARRAWPAGAHRSETAAAAS
jgi:hypothetical protein